MTGTSPAGALSPSPDSSTLREYMRQPGESAACTHALLTHVLCQHNMQLHVAFEEGEAVLQAYEVWKHVSVNSDFRTMLWNWPCQE